MANDNPPSWWLNWNSLTYANPDIFGPLVGGHTVQEAVYQTLEKWLPTYIYEFNRVLGTNALTIPKEYRVKPDFRNTSPRVEASVLVICDGTDGKPVLHGRDTLAVWPVNVHIFVSGPSDWQETQALSFAYGAACRAAIAQHKSLGGIAQSSVWTGEKYMEKEHTPTRTYGLMLTTFDITTPTTIDPFAGPPSPQYGAPGASEPSLDPPGPPQQVEVVQVAVQNTEE